MVTPRVARFAASKAWQRMDLEQKIPILVLEMRRLAIAGLDT
jgi:hypothetical protein